MSAVISFDFTARIDDPNLSFAVGTPVTGNFSYDTAFTPNSLSPGGAFYDSNPAFKLTINVLGQSLSGTGFAGVGNDVGDIDDVYDSFFLYAATADYFLNLEFFDPSAQAFGSTSLPTSFPALYQGVLANPNDDDDLTVPNAQISYFHALTGNEMRASVLSITPSGGVSSAVPEPANWAMMIAGFGMIGAMMRASRNRRRHHGMPARA